MGKTRPIYLLLASNDTVPISLGRVAEVCSLPSAVWYAALLHLQKCGNFQRAWYMEDKRRWNRAEVHRRRCGV